MKFEFRRKWRWIVWVIAIWLMFPVITLVLLELLLNDRGPAADEAFRQYIKNPIPKSVTGLRIYYVPHMRGYWIYLVFSVAPDDLTSLFDLHQSTDPVPSMTTDGVTEYPGWTKGFRMLDQDGFTDMMTKGSCYFQGDPKQVSSLNCNVIISADHRKVYYYRFRD
jgi:hypothetical protein